MPSRPLSFVSAIFALSPLLGACGVERSASYEPRTAGSVAPAAYAVGGAAADGAPAATSVERDSSAQAPAPLPGASAPPPGAPARPASAPPIASAPGAAPAEPAKRRELVIYTARLVMAVYEVEQGLAAVEKIARDNGGYLALRRDHDVTVRVPRARFDTTLAAVDEIGNVLHRDVQAEDVTEAHVDLEIRIKNARAMQQRLSDLLTRASVKDALEIERELHRVTEQLERLEGQMKVLRDRVAFSTLTVTFQPRPVAAPLANARVRLPFPWLPTLNLASLLSLNEEK